MVTTPSLDVTEVLDALETFIKQRPGMEPANYGIHPEQLAYSSPSQRRDAWRSYRSELRSITKDRKEALALLDEARGLDPRPAILADSFRAFSGRLEWVPDNQGHAVTSIVSEGTAVFRTCFKCDEKFTVGADAVELVNELSDWFHPACWNHAHHLSYTTGQYFPTEYRKAAAAVLRAYIAGWRQSEA